MEGLVLSSGVAAANHVSIFAFTFFCVCQQVILNGIWIKADSSRILHYISYGLKYNTAKKVQQQMFQSQFRSSLPGKT